MLLTNIINMIFFLVGVIMGYFTYKFFYIRIYHGPNSKDIVDKIYKKNNKYYKFIPVITICPICISMNNK
jgi:hypothetical protein